MRRLLALLAMFALLAAACSGEPSATGGNDPVGQETQDGVDGEDGNGGNGDDGNGGGEDDGVTVPGNSPPPEVQPSLPGPGEPTAIEFEVLRSGIDPQEGDLSRPGMRLVRNAEAAETAASGSPAAGAAEAIRSWSEYTQRAVIAVYGGAQPDSGYAIRVTDVTVTEGGEVISVFAKLRVREGAASQVISVPWTVVTIEAGAAVLAVRCVLVPEGQSAVQARC